MATENDPFCFNGSQNGSDTAPELRAKEAKPSDVVHLSSASGPAQRDGDSLRYPSIEEATLI